MSDFHETHPPKLLAAGDLALDMALDRGLRDYMLGVYNKVALGLLLAGGLAYLTSTVPAVRDLMFRTVATEGAPRLAGLTLLGSLVTFAPLFVLLFANFALSKPSPFRTGVLYWTVVALMGASLGVLVLAFTGASVAATFAISAAAFGGLSLVGYVTKRDLTAVGSFLTMGVVGLVVGLVVNLFLQSPAIFFVANLAGVLIFAGLIAYDTQRLKLAYYKLGGDEAAMGVATNYGALSLFINFINLFQFLLMMMSGERR